MAVGAQSILTTANGGRSWTPRTVPAGIGTVSAVSCPSTSDCMAVGFEQGYEGTGSEGAAITTTDGGATWPSSTLPVDTTELTGVSCPAVATCPAVAACTAVGYDFVGAGVVLATIGDGASWAAPTVPTGVFGLDGVSCADGTCAAVGTDTAGTSGTVAVSTGGSTLEAETAPPGVSRLAGIACGSAQACEAVGSGSAVGGSGVIIGSDSVGGPLVPTTLTPSLSPASVHPGTAVTYSATVTSNPGTGTPTGMVTFVVGSTSLCGTTLTAGAASCSATDAPPPLGLDSVVATYRGDDGVEPTWAATPLAVDSVT
ncbi:MAG: Ig-like domain repeat protein, partial [Acidimicrobiales bacterium]